MKPKGWRNESRRHSLASKGIKTAQKIPRLPKETKKQDKFLDLQDVSWIALSRPWVGGFSAVTKDYSSVSASFYEPRDLFELAEKFNIKEISLAGDWSKWGEKGYGQTVSIKRAKELSKLDNPMVI